MSEENIHELQAMLEKLGFSGRTAWELEAFRNSDTPSFHLFYGRSVGEDTLLYGLEFRRGEARFYSLTGYDLSLTRVEIPNISIRDIDALMLELNLKQVDKYYDFFLCENWSEKITKEEYDHITGYMEATNAALERLASWKEGEEVAKLLMFKYWPEVRYRQHFDDYAVLESRYKITQYFPIAQENVITINQSYQFLKRVL
ncbi:hypothetical protein HRH25_21835 [Flavisolibacter sp. BT320]|nr:hypothetical protein [Flavisolibacter longurius]